jgi:hypothetical protein
MTESVAGVVLSHGAVVQSVLGGREVIGGRDDRVLQFSNYTFDFSVWVGFCFPPTFQLVYTSTYPGLGRHLEHRRHPVYCAKTTIVG